jgi:hypothetical protein
MDAKSGGAPERVLGFLHVDEKPAEMENAGDVGLVKLHSSSQDEFFRH